MNLLIIDDEPLILNTVYDQLKKEDLNMERIDMAGSAQEARNMLEKNYYHIFLCDIVMPGEDGITFAKWVLEKYPECKFIFLTAHADFEYMKEAISMQSFDYILQPAEKGELIGVIKRAVMQISIERKNQELMDTGSFFSNREREILDGNAMRYLTGLTRDDSFFKRLLKREGGDSEVRYLPFLVQILKRNSSWAEEERGLLRSIYQNIIDEIMQPFQTGNIIVLRNDSVGNFIAVILFGQNSICDRDRFMEQLEDMRVFFQKLIRLEIVIYCGEFCEYEDLSDMCRQLLAEQNDNVSRVSKIYQVGQISGSKGDQEGLDGKIASWRTLLNQNRFMDFKHSFTHWLNYYSGMGKVNKDMLMKLHQGISEMLLACMAAMDIDSVEVFDENLAYYDFMYCWKQMDEMTEAISYVVDRLYALSNHTDSKDAVQSTIRHIRQNIDSDILVSELAERVGMNPEYLTRIFKKSTGYSLKKFIDNEKMEVAKMLLATTNLPVTIVSGRVGYANYSNFTRSFKQIVGCTPTEFREENTAGIPDRKGQKSSHDK